MPAAQTAGELVRARYTQWLDRERMAANVRALHREFEKQTAEPNVLEEFAAMARLHAELKRSA
jgi:hypothetical protein